MKVKCVRVEYDLEYFGGDYSDVGDYAYVPHYLLDRVKTLFVEKRVLHNDEDVLGAAFLLTTGESACHIVSYNMDEPVDQDGNEWRDCPVLPTGYRYLVEGEIIHDGDMRWETPDDNPGLERANWVPVPSICFAEMVKEEMTYICKL